MFNILSKIFRAFLFIIHTITFNKLPQITSVAVIIKDKKGRFLLQKRSDGLGYCIPGGLSKVGETLENAAIREVFEETGIKIEKINFGFIHEVSKEYPYVNTIFYIAGSFSGKLKDSWEGKAEWKMYDEVKGNLAFNHEEILAKYV